MFSPGGTGGNHFAGWNYHLSCQPETCKMAAAVSPIEAFGYRPSHNASKIRKAGEGNLLTRLFGEQFTKDKKRTFMVLLSLAASLSVYLCVVTMLDSQAARTIVSNYCGKD